MTTTHSIARPPANGGPFSCLQFAKEISAASEQSPTITLVADVVARYEVWNKGLSGVRGAIVRCILWIRGYRGAYSLEAKMQRLFDRLVETHRQKPLPTDMKTVANLYRIMHQACYLSEPTRSTEWERLYALAALTSQAALGCLAQYQTRPKDRLIYTYLNALPHLLATYVLQFSPNIVEKLAYIPTPASHLAFFLAECRPEDEAQRLFCPPQISKEWSDTYHKFRPEVIAWYRDHPT